jgi:hypothetical protein
MLSSGEIGFWLAEHISVAISAFSFISDYIKSALEENVMLM